MPGEPGMLALTGWALLTKQMAVPAHALPEEPLFQPLVQLVGVSMTQPVVLMDNVVPLS